MTTENRDRKDLKIQALLEKVSDLTTRYENEVADLRVELTIMQEDGNRLIGDLTNEVTSLRQQVADLTDEGSSEVVKGEVVEEEVTKSTDNQD